MQPIKLHNIQKKNSERGTKIGVCILKRCEPTKIYILADDKLAIVSSQIIVAVLQINQATENKVYNFFFRTLLFFVNCATESHFILSLCTLDVCYACSWPKRSERERARETCASLSFVCSQNMCECVVFSCF